VPAGSSLMVSAEDTSDTAGLSGSSPGLPGAPSRADGAEPPPSDGLRAGSSTSVHSIPII